MTAIVPAVMAMACATIAILFHNRSVVASLVSLAWLAVGLALAVEYVHQVARAVR